ncbi:hypothetical protein Syun_012350 [Stephania yunnanensis]|uniref:Uncharacterized protein n=1 Tax=Stephania yunnanensis TaxID=152371 RepID=A0AAP0K1I6_9MAGN
MLPSFCMIDPRYLKWFTLETSNSPNFTTPSSRCLVFPNSQCMYSVFVLLNLKPLDSNVFLQSSNFLFTSSLVSSTKTISSANNIHHGISS